jgi:hypothetical protein
MCNDQEATFADAMPGFPKEDDGVSEEIVRVE